MLSQSMGYYGANDDFGQDMRPHEMVIEACSLLDSEIDFSEYDRDGDGVIDNVFVFYAGKGEATGGGANSIWPHSSKISDFTTGKVYEFDNVVLSSYACTNEWVDNHTCGIGTFCHEFSHVMGLPDLYSTTYTGAFTPGEWSLMDHGSYNNGSHTPPYHTGYERYCLGWIEPKVLSEPANISFTPSHRWAHTTMSTYCTPRNNLNIISSRTASRKGGTNSSRATACSYGISTM